MVGRFDGQRLDLDECRRFATPCVRLPDGLYWNMLSVLSELTSGLAEVHKSGARVRSIGIDSWAVDFGLLDGAGGLIANPLSYRDGRGAGAMGETLNRVPASDIYAATGVQFLPINTVYQLVALQLTGQLERAETLLLIPDLLAYWLTGERVAEATNASTTQLFDAATGDWASGLIERLRLPPRLFAPIVEPGTMLGGLLPHVAETTGLPGATPVVAVASHDTASAVVGTPLGLGSAAYISSGTWSLVGVECDRPILTRRAQEANLTNERGFGGSTRLLKNVMGLWLVQECRRAWLQDGATMDHDDLARLAEDAPGGLLFDPDLPDLLNPGRMPERIRAACDRTGQRLGDRPADIARAVFESLACRYREVLDEIEQVTGDPIETVHVTGGGSRNRLLCQLTADITRRTVLAGPVEASALGNVLVQMYAFGEVSSLPEMRDIVRGSTVIEAYRPTTGGDHWSLLYERFRATITSEVPAG
jgi:rhamnulokinase